MTDYGLRNTRPSVTGVTGTWLTDAFPVIRHLRFRRIILKKIAASMREFSLPWEKDRIRSPSRDTLSRGRGQRSVVSDGRTVRFTGTFPDRLLDGLAFVLEVTAQHFRQPLTVACFKCA